MTDTEDPRLPVARSLLAPYGDALAPAQLAGLLSYKSTNQVIDMCRSGEVTAIHKGGGRYSIPTVTLIPWLAARLTLAPEEEK